MTQDKIGKAEQRATTPRAAAIAGLLFAILFTASVVLIRISMPENLSDAAGWAESARNQVTLGLGLMPFAGIAFLWFVGVARDRLGAYEDQFFSTVFFGSGLLFLAMVFVAAGITAGLLASYKITDVQTIGNDVFQFGRAIMRQIFTIYALKMAGVFMISISTLWLRTGVMPRWFSIITYLVAFVMLLSIGIDLWVVLIFPGWVVMVSVYILILNFRRNKNHGMDGMTAK